jgi:hypothetical protein
MLLPLDLIVTDFAQGMEMADARRPAYKTYQPGLGPHTEPLTVALVMAELAAAWPERYAAHQLGVPYADGTRQACDLCLGRPPAWEWAVEVKMIRMMSDNAKPNDNLPTHILSPYPQHRSALTDCAKLAGSALGERKAILMYGYAYPDFPLEPLVEAFEVLAGRQVRLGHRHTGTFQGLIHPVHQQGAVFGWEVLPG